MRKSVKSELLMKSGGRQLHDVQILIPTGIRRMNLMALFNIGVSKGSNAE